METVNLKFIILCCLLAGFSSVQGDDKEVEIRPKKGCTRNYTKPMGCCYKGKFFLEGKTLRISSCESCTCNCGKFECQVMDCAKPPEGCRYAPTATECCNLICEGCNYNGIFIPEGESRTVAPCQYGYCDDGEVFIAIADCARPPKNCHYENTMEQCCNLVCGTPIEVE